MGGKGRTQESQKVKHVINPPRFIQNHTKRGRKPALGYKNVERLMVEFHICGRVLIVPLNMWATSELAIRRLEKSQGKRLKRKSHCRMLA